MTDFKSTFQSSVKPVLIAAISVIAAAMATIYVIPVPTSFPAWGRVLSASGISVLLYLLLSHLAFSRPMGRRLAERDRAMTDLRKSCDEMALQLREHTEELEKINHELQSKITECELASEALRESEVRYQRLLENIDEIVYRIAVDMDDPYRGKVLFISRQVERITGHKPEEFLADPGLWFSLLHPEDVPVVKAQAKTIFDDKEAVVLEYRLKSGDSHEYIWLEDRISPDLDDAGRLVSFLGVARDITRRRRTEQALRESEERYRIVAETASDAIISIDERSTIQFVNRATEKIFGYSAAELIGRPLTILMPDRLRSVHEASFARYIATGEKHIGWGAIQLPGLHKDGREIPLEVSFNDFMKEGRHVITGIARDITERRQRERELVAIATVSAALRTAQTRAEMLPAIVDPLVELLGADGGLLAMRDPATGETVFELGRGRWAAATGTRLRPGEGICGWIMENGQPYLNNNALADPRSARSELSNGLHAVAGVPLIARGQTIGVLKAGRESDIMEAELHLLIAVADIAANAIYRANLYEQTQQRLEHITALRAIDKAITGSLDLRLTLDILLTQVVAQLRVDAADVLLFDSSAQALEYAAGRGLRTTALQHTRIRLGMGYAGKAALERRTVNLPKLNEAGAEFERVPMFSDEGFVAYYAVPLIAKGQVKGVLEIFHRAPLNPDQEWLDFMEALAGQAAIAIDNTELFEHLQRSNAELRLAYEATIEGWSSALDMRDKETEGHTQRVTEMTLRLARAMGIGEAELVHVHRGALLHDIGKMGVPDPILLKPGELTEEEEKILHRHPVYAYQLLSPIVFLRPALDIPYCHHERWDGTGYPRGLKGEQIPLAARIFAVVDVWDALRSDRPYRPAWPEEKVLEHLESQVGSHFDPNVVQAFVELLKSGLKPDEPLRQPA